MSHRARAPETGQPESAAETACAAAGAGAGTALRGAGARLTPAGGRTQRKATVKRMVNTRLRQMTKEAFLRANYWLGQYKEVVWLIGDGRSGTTWIAELLNHEKHYREMFEPFHHRYVDAMRFLGAHPYVRPGDPHPRMRKAAGEVFSGRLLHERVDETNRAVFYKGLLIKDIFANLFAKWASERFPEVKIILLMRNPFAVALSKYEKKNWYWMTDPREFLRQPALCEDFLEPFREIIERTGREDDFIQSQILIWSILHYVPLRQFRTGQLHVIYYESAVHNPEIELAEARKFIDSKIGSAEVRIPEETIRKTSRVCGDKGKPFIGDSPVSAWKDHLSPKQIEAGLETLRLFGFDRLYGEETVPDRAVVEALLGGRS